MAAAKGYPAFYRDGKSYTVALFAPPAPSTILAIGLSRHEAAALVARIAIDGQVPGAESSCDECGARLTETPSVLSREHSDSCSLHPSACKTGAAS